MNYALCIIILLLACTVGRAQNLPVDIWADTDVKKHVMLTPYIAQGENTPCVIVCPGGSYFWHDTENEGVKVAEWLQKNGISAFVLNYRTAYVPAFIFHTRLVVRGNQYPDPQNDLQQSIRYVKNHALLYGIDTTKVGAMGFSAGGHLVMSVAEKYDSPRSRPAFVAPIYPVVSFTNECTHKRSRRGLLGEYRKRKTNYREMLSLEKYVPTDCPPVFLVNCVDDPIVDYRNSELLDSALTAQHVRHQYVQFKTGGHGFGASDHKGTAECRQWKPMFLKWIQTITE
jgi:acetyl esterase/lipase